MINSRLSNFVFWLENADDIFKTLRRGTRNKENISLIVNCAGLGLLTSGEYLTLSRLQLNSFLKNKAGVGVEAIRILYASKCQMHDAKQGQANSVPTVVVFV